MESTRFNIVDDSILVPEVVLPAQLFPQPTSHSPDLALRGGVLQQAIDDVRQYRHRRAAPMRHVYRDAYNWILSNSRSHAFTFVNICEALDLDPSAVRSRLLANAPRPALLNLDQAA